MGKKTSPKINRRLNRRTASSSTALVVTAALSSLLVAAKAPDPHEVHVPLPAQGTLGLWHLLGPVDSERALPTDLRPGEGTVEGLPWQTLVERSGLIDFGGNKTLTLGKPQAAALGTWLSVEEPFDGYLLVSVDGAYRLALDGKPLHTRKLAHRRGRGVEPLQLRLAPGLHRLVFLLERRDNRSYFEAQLRNKSDFSVPRGLAIVPRQTASDGAWLSKLIDLRVSVDTTTRPLALTVTLEAPIGAPAISLPVAVELVPSEGAKPIRWQAGTWDLSPVTGVPFHLRLGPVDRLALGASSELSVTVGKTHFKRRFALAESVQQVLDRAMVLRQGLNSTAPPSTPFDALRATLEFNLTQAIASAFKNDTKELSRVVSALSRWNDAVTAGTSPFMGPGWVQVALRSPYDGAPQSLLLHVPESYDPHRAEKYPLVVALHGYNGSPRKILEAFLDARGPSATVPGLVLAPEAHGNAFYRGAAERAVYDALDWVNSEFSVDRARTSITGVSMGGTGAAEIAFRASDLFSAAAPLCGYQSFFVRRDTANKPLRRWESRLMHLYSPASWAPSGHDVPLYVAHGTRDRPLENSRVLTERYRTLGYHLEQDWPDLGHSVWTKTYRGAGLFPWLTKWKKNLDPPMVRLSTGQLRLARKYWLSLTGFENTADLPFAEAQALPNNQVTLHTRALSGLCLHDTAHLDRSRPLHVTIDDQSLEVKAEEPHCFEMRAGAWAIAHADETDTANPGKLRKEPYVEGPWSDLLAEPLVVVYGSGNPNTVALNRYVAERLFQAPYGVTLNVPVVSDEQYAQRTFTERRAVFVGRPDDHRQFAAISAKLPLQVTNEGLVLGTERFTEPDVGAAFVYPDPERRDRLLGFITAVGPEGLLRVLSLPQLVPDFVVFDHDLDAAAGEPILGPSAFVRAAGFFENDWSLPKDTSDSYVSTRPR